MSECPESSLVDAINSLPEILRESSTLWTERMRERNATSDTELIRLLPLVACSEFAGRTLVSHWDVLRKKLDSDTLRQRPQFDAANDIREKMLSLDEAGLKAALRQCRDQYLVRILLRELAGYADVEVTLSDLSTLADTLICIASEFADARASDRFGKVIDGSGEPVSLFVLAMGKLGGFELNFSSDVDLIFVYARDGMSDGQRSLSANEYFTRVTRTVVNLLDDVTADGFVYRVDTRLRPFGDSGPPVVSFAALESYLLQHGRSWERYAYVKARIIGSAAGSAAGVELMHELIVPFVYRRYIDYGVFESLRDMKALVSAEGRKRELANNIKLGPGGIRDIEFIVQSLQLVRGGSVPDLQSQRLQSVLPQLVKHRALTAPAADSLNAAYRFLRRLENLVQALRDQQDHQLPVDSVDQARVALGMGMTDWPAVLCELEKHRETVSSLFADTAFRTDHDLQATDEHAGFSNLWNASAGIDEWRDEFAGQEFSDAEAIAAEVVKFSGSNAIRQADAVSARRVAHLIPAVLLDLQTKANPAQTLERVLNIVGRVLKRSAYLALLIENPNVLLRVIKLCENSAYLADEIGRYPSLLDEILDPRVFSVSFGADQIRAELEKRLSALKNPDSEQQVELLAQFQRATLFRIALADFSDELPLMKVSDRLTELAEIVVDRALTIAWDDVTEIHGEPQYGDEGQKQNAGFGVIAYGKLGGMELSYRSDLDLVFLHDSSGTNAFTDGEKPLENSMFFGRLLRRLVHFLTIQTGSGAMYEIDTRLRPSGRSGLLVTSIEAFERYQEENAWTWEHQALLRSRPVAGSAVVAREFERIRSDTLRTRVNRQSLLDEVVEMRAKMRSQLDHSGAAGFDLKQGRGGIGDIEFLVQYLVLLHAAEQPAVIHFTDNIRQLGTLQATQCLDATVVAGLQRAYKDYRLRLHRLSLDERPPMVEATEFAELREYVSNIWDDVMTH